jgi:two-component system heavy metal sensor histidine kinase CusS
MLVSAGAVIAVLVLEELEERSVRLTRGIQPEEDEFHDVYKAAIAMGIVAPFAIGAAAFLGLALARRALSPMREASRRASAARASELNLSLPVTGTGDEWDDLATTLNTLLEDARSSLSRIRRFTADAAHELRTPVTTIIGEAEVALRRHRGVEELRAALDTIKGEGERLAALLEALLALSRADAGILLASKMEARLDEIVGRSVTRAKANASESGRNSLQLECVGSAGTVVGNPVLLSRAVENLLDNAIRHATERVTVTLTANERTARVRVADDGPGVPPELVPELFQRFARGDEARAGQGFGLGLSIARAIAEAHHGSVEFRPSPGGAVFELTVPVRSTLL